LLSRVMYSSLVQSARILYISTQRIISSVLCYNLPQLKYKHNHAADDTYYLKVVIKII